MLVLLIDRYAAVIKECGFEITSILTDLFLDFLIYLQDKRQEGFDQALCALMVEGIH